ncbi:ArsR/SmtB family transcription factor [Paenibacillus sp. UNC451MF]|uniref:ArsR/SmtB family transcription factor n=1 Tax=Paenibacillus sp. UNC451MF TaxID=1449063 RepID=UPI000490163B|nr:metalloregulator ArsR/SmtB family transcription factor [Paenibacillus sp. UNC451MF]
MRQNFEFEVAKAAKALSDPIRLKILVMLRKGRQEDYQAPVCSSVPLAVCPADIQLQLDDISPSKLSYHLKELKDEGYIQECREGKRIYYFLQSEKFRQLVESLGLLYD